jgi:ATP-dependent phosphoenolpyruvate carboxykinase
LRSTASLLRRPGFYQATVASRDFGASLTDEVRAHLKSLGLNKKDKAIVFNPSVAELYEYAMLPDHMWSPDDSVGPNSITETGALCISSGSKTGRVPK